MNKVRRLYPSVLLVLSLATILNIFSTPDKCIAVVPKTLAWSIIDTPSNNVNNMVIRNFGINDLALAPDNRTFYIVSTDNTTPNTGLFKSTDTGYSWSDSISSNLARAGAPFPVWGIAVAPDDANFIVAVTDDPSTVVAGGPKTAYYSIDGGSNWKDTSLSMNTNEFISCLDISVSNGGCRDIAVGTRSIGDVQGRLLTARYSSSLSTSWTDQALLPAVTTAITSVAFSPNYNLDQALLVISFTAAGSYLHLGKHDSTGNITTWDTDYTNYPVFLGGYSTANIIRTDIQLPSDYTAGTDMSLSGCFINILDNTTASAVFYVRPTAAIVRITSIGIRIYSIAYTGTNETGILLAGEVTANPAKALGKVWQCFAAQVTSGPAVWIPSDTWKSPTGGGGTGRANVLVAWNSEGSIPYCGTSSENCTLGGTGWAPGQWPFSKLVKVQSDESAFQYSMNNGAAWNQIGIINTIIARLSDVAAYERPEDEDSSTLFLASLNSGSPGIDSVWRSTTNPLGFRWERVLTWPTSDNGIILRINNRDTNSSAIVFADLSTTTVIHSPDEGNQWNPPLLPNMSVNDISMLDDTTIYVLGDYAVRKLSVNSQPGKPVNTNLLEPGHTICIPATIYTASNQTKREIVVIGTRGNNGAYVAWADFAESSPKFTPLKQLPEQGDVHVVVNDESYEKKLNIYAGITNSAHNSGNIYRWTVGTSINWDQLDPINRSFFGISMLNNVLYGAWNTDMVLPITSSGVDRTLDAKTKVPPPPEWDELRDGLPASPIIPLFTCEPSSLHSSWTTYNRLWAIDNQNYNFSAQTGCLWSYIDSVARLGPWPTSPAPGGFIGPDPSSGRAQQIDFKWRPLKDIFGYDILLAKDANFTLLLGRQVPVMTIADNTTSTWVITPQDNLTGAWIVTPADQENPCCWISPGILETGRPYYWKVRGSRSVMQTPIHSPWSPTMLFYVKPGFIVDTDCEGPTLLNPVDGSCHNCLSPVRFTWTTIKDARKYEFILASDPELQNIIVKTTITSTSYDYTDKLELSKPYYWQVKAVSPVISNVSPIGTFTLVSSAEALINAQNRDIQRQNTPADWSPSPFTIRVIMIVGMVLLLLVSVYAFLSRRQD